MLGKIAFRIVLLTMSKHPEKSSKQVTRSLHEGVNQIRSQPYAWRKLIVAIIGVIILTGSATLFSQIVPVAASNIGAKDPILDFSKWEPRSNNKGQITQNVNCTITSNMDYDYSGGYLYSPSQFEGDFDVQVDYSGIHWDGVYPKIGNADPHLVAAEMGISTYDVKILMTRMIFFGDISPHFAIYNATPPGDWRELRWEDTSSADMGKFRIVRKGSQIDFKYFSKTSWISLYTVSGITKPLSIFIGAETGEAYYTFTTVFSNFQVNSSPVEPASNSNIFTSIGAWVSQFSLYTLYISIAMVGSAIGIISFTRNYQKERTIHKIVIADFMEKIESVYTNFKMNSRDCEVELYKVKGDIIKDFKEGKMDSNSYTILEKKIEDYLVEIKKQINKI
jgi:hypothetical protein